MSRYVSSRLDRSQPPPQLHRFGMKQAFHALMQEARRRGLDFRGRPTGVYQKGWQVYLYVDIGVGRVTPRIVKEVPPLNAREFLPPESVTAVFAGRTRR